MTVLLQKNIDKISQVVLAAILILSLLVAPVLQGRAEAAPVTQPGAWSAVAGQASDGTTLAGSYTAAAGANRLLVVALTAEFSGAVSLSGINATYGGQALTMAANSSPAGEGDFAAWVGYLTEQDLAAAADTTLTISWTDNQVATSLNLFAATYADANQIKPFQKVVTNSAAVNAPITFGADVDYLRESKVFYLAGYGGTNATTIHVAGFTERLAAANFNGSVVTVADKDDTSVNAILPGTTSVDFAGTNAYHGLVAGAINAVFNPMVHSSGSTGSTKWSGQGGWGVAGGRYGEFTCATCHGKDTGNVKRVKTTVVAPNSPTNNFPGSAVSLLSTENGSSDFGDDTGAHAVSTKICEACHSYDASRVNGVKFHAFDMSAGGADLSHENRNDCIQCHLHNAGFAAGSCDGCHQANGVGHADTSENAGLHDAHMASGYITTCDTCHPHNGSGAAHVNGTVNFNNTNISNTYDYAKAASFGGTCGAVNGCHDSDADEWENGDLGFAGDNACQDCHGSAATFFSLINGWTNGPNAGPTSNEHQAHLGNGTYVTGCSACHPHNGAMGGQHVDTTLQETVSYNSGNGTCANACHFVVDGRDWTSGGTLNCADCHDADVAGGQADGYYSLDGNGWPPVGGSHVPHVGTGANAAYGLLGNYSTVADYEFGCGECHGTTASNHVNGINNIESGTLGYAAGSCSTAACHSHKANDGVTTVYAPTPAWGTSFSGDRCAGCHKNSPESAGHEEHQMGFHSEHVYTGKTDLLPVLDSDPLPANLAVGPYGRDQLRGHGGLLDSDRTPNSTTLTCYVCHNNTVKVKYNDQATLCKTCHDGTGTIAPTMGDMVVADKRYHVNGVADVVFVNDKIRSKAQVRDDLMDVPELSDNWSRVGGYKVNDGSSYDEQPDTLANMASLHGGWNSTDKTCMISCHLWEAGRVDKYPADWIDNSIHGSQPIMCIDCHTRLPK